jgi:transposase-like protein
MIRSLADLEREAILSAIEEMDGDKKKAAKALGISKTTLYRKLREYREEGTAITPPVLDHARALAAIPLRSFEPVQSGPQIAFLRIPSTPLEKQQLAKARCPRCRTELVVPVPALPSSASRM